MRIYSRMDPGFLTLFHGLGVPDAGLNLADVAVADHQHAEAALAHAAADGLWQLAVQQHLVEGQLVRPLLAPGQLQLASQMSVILTSARKSRKNHDF